MFSIFFLSGLSLDTWLTGKQRLLPACLSRQKNGYWIEMKKYSSLSKVNVFVWLLFKWSELSAEFNKSPPSYFQVALTESAQWRHQQAVILERWPFSALQQPRSLCGISFSLSRCCSKNGILKFKIILEHVMKIDGRSCMTACILSVPHPWPVNLDRKQQHSSWDHLTFYYQISAVIVQWLSGWCTSFCFSCSVPTLRQGSATPTGFWEMGPPWLAGSDKEGTSYALNTAL